MPIISSSLHLNAGPMIVFSTIGEGYHVLDGIVLSVDSGAVFDSFDASVANVTLSIDGTIVGLSGTLIQTEGANNRVVIGATGRVSLLNTLTPFDGIQMLGTAGTVINHGRIDVAFGNAISFVNDFGQLMNTGTITSAYGGVVMLGAGISAVNHGTIAVANANQAVWGLLGTGGLGHSIVNHGTITATGYTGTAAIVPVNDALVLNHGLIQGSSYGILAVSSGWGVDVQNFGTIAGGANYDPSTGTTTGPIAMALDDQANSVINRGSLVGSVFLNGGADTFDGRGGQAGSVDGGSGNDTYLFSGQFDGVIEIAGGGNDTIIAYGNFDMSGTAEVEVLTLRGGAISGTGNASGNVLTGNANANLLDGEAGNDTIYGYNGNDTVWGGEGNDTVYGHAGSDHLMGDNGIDYLYGGDGDDTVDGGLAQDRVEGGNGDDLVIGGVGIDTILGGAGADTLRGGASRDFIYGGLDEDVFEFRALSDSRAGTSFRDSIMDWEAGIDLIDLQLIDANTTLAGNQAFSWVGTGALTAAGQLGYVISGPDVIIRGDVTGDLVVDFEIRLAARTTVWVSDILL